MMKYNLNGNWILNSELFNNISVNIPGSVLSSLISNKLIDDPFQYRNELKTTPYLKYDYEFKKEFIIKKEDLIKHNYLFLDGIDTIADVYINNYLIISVNDMHIQYRVLLENKILKEKNEIKILFKSPINYINSIDKKKLFYSWGETMRYSPSIRKANYMFGWDWGPNLPDIGIYRDIYILSTEIGYLDNFRHYEIFNNDKTVDLNIDININNIGQGKISTTIKNNTTILNSSKELKNNNNFNFHIDKPMLWNPIGYGEPNLYDLIITIYNDNEKIEYNYKIGLRKIFIDDSKDEYGLRFKLYVNDNPVYIKGSDFIPQDNILSRVNYDNTYKLLKLAKDFNHNTIRVWGGGYYLDDYFYDICDELGLLVFQDYMFACAVYDSKDTDFMSLIEKESINVIKRIRHHASIFMMCGNNENEVAISSWKPYRRKDSMESFKDMYLVLLKNITKEYSDFYYLESSPTSREPYFKNPNDESSLDMHYWDVWHGYKPFSAYKKIYPRLLSEFGCQSFPLYETVLTYAKEKDLDIFSKVMMHHQKNKTCNDKILGYVRSMYKDSKDFRSLVYLSLITQAEGIKTCVEHLRSNRGRNEGVIYWQLNDCWPGQSWSSLDYYLRPKALHYYSKKFYDSILSITDIKNDKLVVTISNDELVNHEYKIILCLEDFDGKEINIGETSFSGKIDKSSMKEAVIIDDPFVDTSKEILKVTLIIDNKCHSHYYYSKVYPKNLKLKKAKIKAEMINDYEIKISTNTFTKGIALEPKDKDIIFSDNYFDLDKNEDIIISSNKKVSLDDIYISDLSDTW